jgi:uroporphyrinogen-III decarboxylase
MIPTNQSSCGHLDSGGLDPQLAAELGLSFPEMHYNAQSMSLMAVAIMKKNRIGLAMLPFCCTVKAEALGAKINLGNSTVGPRPGDFVYKSLAEFLEAKREIDLNAGRLAAVLKACEITVAHGHKIAVEVNGPLTILNCLMELSQVVKVWRKDERLMGQALQNLGAQIIRYVLALKKSGVSIISYADPIAAPHIIGPKYSRSLAQSFLAVFLNQLRAELHGLPVHLCPNNARLLIDCDLGQWNPISLRPEISYQEGCLELAGQVDFLGQTCLKRCNYYPHEGIINEFKLKAIPLSQVAAGRELDS